MTILWDTDFILTYVYYFQTLTTLNQKSPLGDLILIPSSFVFSFIHTFLPSVFNILYVYSASMYLMCLTSMYVIPPLW